MAKKSARARKAARRQANGADARRATSPRRSRGAQTNPNLTPDEQKLQENPTLRRRGDALDQRDSQSQTEEQIKARTEGKPGKSRAMNVDEATDQTENAKPSMTSVIDHGQGRHPREEQGGHTLGHPTRARVEAPPPRDVTKLDDMEQIAEQLRLETKADNLIYMHRQERAKEKPRQAVLDGIVARLREVQGDPLPPLD